MRIKNYLQIFLSIILIVFIYINLDQFKVLSTAQETVWYLLLFVVIFFSLVKVFGAIRYTIIASSIKQVSFLKIFEIEIIMVLVSYTVLPGITAEISRAYLIIKEFDFNKSQAILSITYDRAVGLAGNITTTIFGLLLFLMIENYLNLISSIILFLFFIALMIIFMFTLLKFKNLLSRIKLNFIKSILEGLMEIGSIIEKKKLTIILAYFFSILMQISNVFGVFIISLAVGQDIPLHVMMLIVPTVGIILAIPITFSGIGIRELSYVSALNFLNVAKEVSFIIAIYSWLLFFITNVLLFVWYKLCEYSMKFYNI